MRKTLSLMLLAAVVLVAGAGKPESKRGHEPRVSEVCEVATRTWSGAAGDGNFNTVANWGGTVPVTGDSVIISASASTGITSNLDRSADGAGAGLNIVDFTIQRGFAYNIGASGNTLRMTADLLRDEGNGELYFTSRTGTAALTTDRVIIDKGDISKAVYLYGISSNIVEIEVRNGNNISIGDGSTSYDITTLWIVPDAGSNTVQVTGYANATIATTHMFGGTFIIDGVACTTINMGNGVLNFLNTTIATVNQYGGLIVHDGEASNYAIQTLNGVAGYLVSDDTPGLRLITALKRGPQWDMKYNPKLTVSGTTYIGE